MESLADKKIIQGVMYVPADDW
ncbi:hypothetical protein Goklo_003622 [Gossypium klotzschianum]|uniref:Uncharacterized protein n=1 Tax=Gossypium klotzschianum TaxID=34286 RepID=A0A7J8VL82_9ROSI|nr:hypothetical protein [Gossypium klotzschianum]MBA0663509.1 hypothetical protein [Gossypium klotzschianum]